MTLSGATHPGQSGFGRDGYEGVVRIPHTFSNTGASSLDCLTCYQDTGWGGVLRLSRGEVSVSNNVSRLGMPFFKYKIEYLLENFH